MADLPTRLRVASNIIKAAAAAGVPVAQGCNRTDLPPSPGPLLPWRPPPERWLDRFHGEPVRRDDLPADVANFVKGL